MKIAVAGGTGFVGKALVSALTDRGDEVWVISRKEQRQSEAAAAVRRITWEQLESDPLLLKGIDGIVNLAGETINQRWTDGAKQRILHSRLTAAQRLARMADALPEPPQVLVNASATALYGNSLSETFDEDSPVSDGDGDFLSSVVRQWEQAAMSIRARRSVLLRVGIVVGMNGGALPQMLLPFRLFAGGPVGSGKQWMSWIHLDDMVRLLLFSLDNSSISGPVNATSPDPVRNEDFGRAIAASLGKPFWLPVPAFMLKLLFGELAVLLLEGQRAVPKKALAAGFTYRYGTIQAAMDHLLRSH
ncbi:TIGR01777 family oxidoreductase [Paenibacillus beijingensis]|uniref:Multidrug MFS transporter n=1 Tax=Paenibacillus beijingensis TaxID=1126833 RepID=A0A0D5NF59_9BACL|nr:TIGR01777 family oxidoreductase [Paenibacillus beijingensis]AJY73770.1 hypothetical protein VN24_02890 [Paenibacillus beijingensis]